MHTDYITLILHQLDKKYYVLIIVKVSLCLIWAQVIFRKLCATHKVTEPAEDLVCYPHRKAAQLLPYSPWEKDSLLRSS